MMFSISQKKIDVHTYQQQLQNDKAGGFVSFEGLVRNHNEGRSVNFLEYEAYEEMCQIEGEKILLEAQEKFAIYDARCVHRVGELQIGEMAVWVGVNSAHRKASFDACQYIIDQVKVRLPIWKKEHYTSGKIEWVNCQQCAHHGHHQHTPSISKEEYYARQLVLPELKKIGQSQLSAARVLVVGAGGLGSPAIEYLARAGVGHVGICDGDLVSISNLHRQTLYSIDDLNLYKADIAAKNIQRANPFVDVSIFREFLDFENAENIIQKYDIILDCTDNFVAKFLCHDVCWKLDKTLIQAAIYQLEGQIQIFKRTQSHSCMRCLWPEVPNQKDIGSCAEAGVFGATAGILGSMQAMEAIKIINDIPHLSFHSTLFFDLQNYQSMSIERSKNKTCKLCQSDFNSFQVIPANYDPKLYDWELKNELDELESLGYNIIDIRSSDITIENLIPMIKDHKSILVCHRGVKSRKMSLKLRELGHSNVYSHYFGFDGKSENTCSK